MQYKNMNFYNIKKNKNKKTNMYWPIFKKKMYSLYTWQKYKYIYICIGGSGPYCKKISWCLLHRKRLYKCSIVRNCCTLNNVFTALTNGICNNKQINPACSSHTDTNTMQAQLQKIHTRAHTHSEEAMFKEDRTLLHQVPDFFFLLSSWSPSSAVWNN